MSRYDGLAIPRAMRRALPLLPNRLRGHFVKAAHRFVLPETYVDQSFGVPFEYRRGYGEACQFFGLYERNDLKCLQSLLRPGMTVFDVGAHIGWYTAMFLGQVGPSGTVVSVEPHPDNLTRLRRLGELVKGTHKLEIIDAAVAASEGSTTLYLNRYSAGHSIVPPPSDHVAFDGSSMQVRTVTLAQLIIRFGPIDVVKIDVENAENDVLLGASDHLGSIPIVFVEVNDRNVHGESNAVRVHALMESRGYSSWIATRYGLKPVRSSQLLGHQTNVFYFLPAAVPSD